MADRYWRGGTGTWDAANTTNWSTTSGGGGGASVPTAADAVFFNASSGSGTVIISTGTALSIDCTGYTQTWSGSGGLTVSGSVTFVAGMTVNWTGTLTLVATGTLITGGKTIGPVTVNGSGITVTLGDALNIGSNALTVTQGTFTTSASNYAVTAGSLVSSNTNTRTITLNGSTLTLSGATPVNFTDSTNLTFTAGTSTINVSNDTAVVQGGGRTFRVLAFTSANAGTRTLNGANTFTTLTLTASASGLSELSLGANQTVSGTFTCAGTSATQRGFVRSDTFGTARTITVATLAATNCDFRDIALAGAASPATPTRAGNCGGNTNINFTIKTVYWNLTGTQNWNATGWATTANGSPAVNNFPLPQDTATFTDSGSAGTISLGVKYNFPNITAATRTSAMTLDHNVAAEIYGSYTLGSGVTISGTSALTFRGSSTTTFTSAGKTITFPIVIFMPSATTFQLGDAFTSSNTITHTQGTFNAANYALTCTAFSSSNSNTRTITMGSGLWTLTGTGTVWNTGTTTSLTFNKDTANITLSDTSATSRTFAGGGVTYNKLTIGGTTGTSTTTITGINTFSELASTKTVAHTITFSNSQTFAAWTVTGSLGNVVTINSGLSTATRTLTLSSGYLADVNFLLVRNLIASPPSDAWYIGSGSQYNTTSPNTASNFLLTQRQYNVVLLLTSTASTTFTVPGDWNSSSNTIHLIGGGGGGGGSVSSTRSAGGGGGGGYTQLLNQTLTPGASIPYQCGAAGLAATVTGGNGTAGGTTSWDSGAATAGGGGAGSGAAGSAGGTAGSGTTFNGGAGGAGFTGSSRGGGGGAGAGGPNGNGGNGGNGGDGFLLASGGGGGGNGGGTNGLNGSSSNGDGGNNFLGFGGGEGDDPIQGSCGGGGGGGDNGGAGIDIFGLGGGGGGGGNARSAGGTASGGFGALYGGGGGGGYVFSTATDLGEAGAQGAIILVYGPGELAGFNFLMFFG
jgi:hypothetical protein